MEFRVGDIVRFGDEVNFTQGALERTYSKFGAYPLLLRTLFSSSLFSLDGRYYEKGEVVLKLISRPKKTVIKYQWLLQPNRSGNCYVTQEKYSESEILMTYLGGSKLISRIEESAEEFEVEED